MRGETVALLGIYDRQDKLGIQLQVRDRSSAVMHVKSSDLCYRVPR